MGTAAFDKIVGPAPQKTTAFDKALGATVPDPTSIQPVQDEGIFDTLGNIAKSTRILLGYSAQQLFDPYSQPTPDQQARDNFIQTAKIVGSNVGQFSKDIYDIAFGADRSAAAKYVDPLIQLTKEKGLGSTLGSAAKGMVTGLAHTPLDILQTITGKDVDQDGNIIPIDPNQRAQAVQSTIALIASGATANSIIKASTLSDAELLGIKNVSYPGLLAKTAVPKLVAGAGGGAVFGGVSNMGNDNMLVSAIGGALAGMGLGVLHEAFTLKSDVSKIRGDIAKAEGARDVQTVKSSSELLATRYSQITDQDTPEEIAAKIKSIPLSDNEVDAAINSTLTIGKQFITHLPSDQVDRLIDKYTPTKRASEGLYTPSEETQKVFDKSKIADKNGRIIEPVDPFDRATLLSESNPGVLDDLQEQTDLSEPEIRSHRNYIKSQIKTAPPDAFYARTPFEAQAVADKAQELGSNIIQNTVDGKSFNDINGNKWLRQGSLVTNGQTALNISDPSTHQILGTRTGEQPNAQIWRMPKQNFSPEYGRELNTRVSIYKGPDGSTLVSSYPLAPDVKAFYERTGFQANELVTAYGRPYTVEDVTGKGNIKARNLATGKVNYLDKSLITRMPNGLDSEFFKADNGTQITRMGILNRESYMDSLYDRFRREHFDLDKEPQDSYNGSVQKFANSIGMKNQDDIADMSRVFYSKMIDEVVKDDPELKEIHSRTLDNMQGWMNHLKDNRAANFSEMLRSNNMSMVSRPGGIFDLRSNDGGKTLFSAKNFDEAMGYLTQGGQAKGFDLDGGFSNGTPMIGGTLSQTWNVEGTGKWADRFSKMLNVGRAAKTLAMQKSAILEGDNTYGTKYYKHYVALQIAQNLRATTAGSNVLADFIRKSNDAFTLGYKIDPMRRAELGGTLTALSADEITNKFQLRPEDVRLAQNIAKVGSGEVTDFLYTLRDKGNWAEPVGSVQFMKRLATEGSAYPDISAQAGLLVNKMDGSPRAAGILALANNLEKGTGDIGSITSAERKYVDAIQAAHQSMPGVSDPLFTHLYYSKLAELTGHNPFPGFSDQFHRAVNRYGSSPSNQTELDPSAHVYNMRLAAINTAKVMTENDAYFNGGTKKISFKDVVDRAQREINSKPTKDDPDYDDKIKEWSKQNPARMYFQQHLDNVKGIPDDSEKMAAGLNDALEKMGQTRTTDLVRFGAALTYSSLLGFRPAFALRDAINVYQNIAMFDSFEMANKAMGRSVSKEATQTLIDRGIIAGGQHLQLLDAGEDIIEGMGRLSKAGQAAAKLSDIATKFNGQQLVHTQASAGTYLAYQEKVLKLSDKMLKNETTKADAYDQLKIQKLPPEEQKFFDDLISAGKTSQAADFLGRSMVDRFNTVYGRNNAPQAWRSWFGRLAGGFGQWATHQINTNIDMLGRGTNRQIAASIVKMGAMNAAITAAGIYSGINLSRWVISPISLPGESPLLAGITGAVSDGDNATNIDPAISDPATSKLKKMLPFYLDNNDEWQFRAAHLYLPMSYFAQGIYDSYKMAQGDFGPSALANFMGFSTIKGEQSQMQQQMGFSPEWNGRSVSDEKGIGPKLGRLVYDKLGQ